MPPKQPCPLARIRAAQSAKTSTSPTARAAALHPDHPETIKGDGLGQLRQPQPPPEPAATIPPQAPPGKRPERTMSEKGEGEERHTTTTGTPPVPAMGGSAMPEPPSLLAPCFTPTRVLAQTDERPLAALRPSKKGGGG
ncbi:hypothetical protein ZWY2020_026349 [Hordeum vulgare]|nr:hypothetical protein ZWY2020_026349 [Hordeum vulgare]